MTVLRFILGTTYRVVPAIMAAVCTIAVLSGEADAQVISQAPVVQPKVPFTLTSPDIKSDGSLPNLHSSCNRPFNNQSPALVWDGAPQGTKSFAVVLQLARQPRGARNVGWFAHDIPATRMSLPRDAGNQDRESIPGGGTNNFLYDYARGYIGPCPTSEYPEQYSFVVYALDIGRLAIAETIDRHKDHWRDVVLDSVKAHTLDSAFLRVRSKR